jgi:hypothetical protein
MSVAVQPAAKGHNPFTVALAIGCAGSALLFAGLLRAFGVSLTTPSLVIGAAALLWLAYRHPIGSLGGALAFMPVFPVTFLLAKLLGPAYVGKLEGCDRVVLVVLVFILWLRGGIKLKAPDWFLIACFGLAALRFAFGGILINFLAEFSFMIPYFAGRMLTLTAVQESVWATRAVWIVAVLSVLGMSEVIFFGPGPRAILYSTFQTSFASDGTLGGGFYVTGYEGLRESSTMISPPYFGLLCMVSLIIWWVYRRSVVPACMIAAGLILSITRSAWLNSAVAIAALAVVMGQKKRFLQYATPALALAIAIIFLLGLGDFVSRTIGREEPMAEGHKDMLVEGWEYVSTHPFGAGPGNYDRPTGAAHDISSTSHAPYLESTYLAFAAEYGVIGCLCFLGFLITALRASLSLDTQLGYAAVGILIGFAGAMVVAPILVEFSLACWVWFPIGMAVRSSTAMGT